MANYSASTNGNFDFDVDFGGAVTTYEESGTYTRRPHSHTGYSSGFSPSRDEWDQYTSDGSPYASAARPAA
jgi:hypothetical protein